MVFRVFRAEAAGGRIEKDSRAAVWSKPGQS